MLNQLLERARAYEAARDPAVDWTLEPSCVLDRRQAFCVTATTEQNIQTLSRGLIDRTWQQENWRDGKRIPRSARRPVILSSILSLPPRRTVPRIPTRRLAC
jgi:hypothetical protein